MLFDERFWPGVHNGAITVAFRRWKRPTVKTGGTLIWAADQLAIDNVATIDERDITDADAVRAGYTCLDELLLTLNAYEGALYRIDFHVAGPDPRIALRANAALTAADLADLRTRLARLDAASPDGPWTAAVLHLIAENPATLARHLAIELDEPDLARFKTRVRRLKALGLTESLPIGYEISPRGQAYLDATEGE